MKRSLLIEAVLALSLSLLLTGCERKVTAQEPPPGGTGPVPITVEPDMDPHSFKVDHPERFPLATGAQYVGAPAMNVTSVVNPDVSLQVPVPSLATGRIVEIDG